MAKTGPQKYPGASTDQWHQGRWGGDSMESNVIVWHTTEGTSLPDYDGGSQAPNFTAVPDFTRKRLVWHQHFDFDTSSRALKNAPGGVDTNTLNVVSVELVGTCDPTAHKRWKLKPHLYTPELPDWAIRDLAAFAKWAHDNHGVPLTSGLTFKAYPGSWGPKNGVRMSDAKWSAFKGHCGHQHVPENDHGDPGQFPIAAILSAAAPAKPAEPVPPRSIDSVELALPSDYTSVSMTAASWSIANGQTFEVYFPTEHADDPGDHGLNGKGVLTGPAEFTGAVKLKFSAPAPAGVTARLVRQEANATVGTEWMTDVTAGDTHFTFPVIGTVAAGQQLVLTVVNNSGGNVTLNEAYLRLFSQTA